MSQEVRLFQEGMFTASDETSLYFRHWSATEGNSKKVIVLFHRGHEHSGRLQHIVDELMMPDTHFTRGMRVDTGSRQGLVATAPALLARF